MAPIVPDGWKAPSVSWTDVAPGWLQQNSSTLKSFLARPEVFVIQLILTWLITNLVIRPTAYTVAWIDWAWTTATTTVNDAFRSAYGGAARGISMAIIGTPSDPGLVRSLNQQLVSIAMQGGLAAPIASALVLILNAVIVTTLAVLVVRILLDLIPGGGAFFK